MMSSGICLIPGSEFFRKKIQGKDGFDIIFLDMIEFTNEDGAPALVESLLIRIQEFAYT